MVIPAFRKKPIKPTNTNTVTSLGGCSALGSVGKRQTHTELLSHKEGRKKYDTVALLITATAPQATRVPSSWS